MKIINESFDYTFDVLCVHLRSRSLKKICESGRLLCNGSIIPCSVRFMDPSCVSLILEI